MENKSLFKEYEGIFKTEAETPEAKGKKEKTYSYSPFALQDAIGERDVKRIWIEYQKIILKGIAVEDVVHQIIKKVKDMAAISRGASAADLSLKDFPYNKSKRDLKNWPMAELERFYEKLVNSYHQSRMGGEALATALEKILLSI